MWKQQAVSVGTQWKGPRTDKELKPVLLNRSKRAKVKGQSPLCPITVGVTLVTGSSELVPTNQMILLLCRRGELHIYIFQFESFCLLADLGLTVALTFVWFQLKTTGDSNLRVCMWPLLHLSPAVRLLPPSLWCQVGSAPLWWSFTDRRLLSAVWAQICHYSQARWLCWNHTEHISGAMQLPGLRL